MAENRKKKNQQKLPWWLMPVLLLAVLAIWFGGEALGRGFQWLSDSQTSESSTTAQKVPADETLTVRILDVGQGDSILLACGDETMLIDGGPVEEGQFLVSRLNRLDVTELTYVVNTHPDEDHCGGLAAVLAKYPAEHVYSSVTEYTTKVFSNVVKYTEEQGKQIEVPQTGTHWSLGSATVTVIGPVQEYSDPNNGSLVLRVDYGGTSFLFTGDMEQKAEGDLLESGADVHADVLKAGHHGSPTSSSEAFLTAVQPSVAVISVGADNDYGHPGADVLARLEALNAEIYRTDTQGEIIIVSIAQSASMPEVIDLLIGQSAIPQQPRTGGREGRAVRRQPQFHDRPQRKLRQAPRRGEPHLLQFRRRSGGIRLQKAHVHQITALCAAKQLS